MNVKYKIRYLEDPKAIWGKNTAVYTAVNPQFAKHNVNVACFFKQMVLPSTIQSEWIYAYGYEKNRPTRLPNNRLTPICQRYLTGSTA